MDLLACYPPCQVWMMNSPFFCQFKYYTCTGRLQGFIYAITGLYYKVHRYETEILTVGESNDGLGFCVSHKSYVWLF